ncbi:protein BTG3-like [Rhinoderma darwinii]|uniref:protein BTG3-like n=1 Tax=Rhinoderma darwinii TaxID=43563 RepID=UPI003F66E419
MRLEIEAAVNFLVKIFSLKKTLKPDQLDALGKNLVCLLCDKYQGHWYPDKPARGQAFRCIRINSWQYVDESLLQACNKCGIEYSRLPLPEEITLWIDPFDVCGRFGEHTDYFTIATFEHIVVSEPVLDCPERETSDYSSAGPSSGTISENSSDDETSGEKATTTENEIAPDEAIGISSSNAETPVDELMDSEVTTCHTGSDMDEQVAQETRELSVGNGS